VKEPGFLIRHALDCIERIHTYTNSGQNGFVESTLIQDAVVRNLQIMCESLSRVPEDIRNAHPHVEWRGIAGLRNILVHDYFGVDTGLVWQVIETRLPELESHLKSILASLKRF
jgi:uncharacterized protein with HEPN domain